MAFDSGVGETLARYLTQRSQYRPSDNTVKHTVFMPPASARLSVYCIDDLSEAEICTIGRDYVAAPMQKTLLGRADLNSLRVYENKLRIDPTQVPHLRHADIVGWDMAGTETRLIAMKLASAAFLRLVPNPN